MLLRRSVVLVTTLASALAVTGAAAAGAAADPAPAREVEPASAPQEVRHPSKTAAQLAAGRELVTAADVPDQPRRRTETTGSPAGSAESSAESSAAAATSAGSSFTPVAPVRVLDTRSGTGAPAGPLTTRQQITLDLSSHVPDDATAVVLNVTGVAPSATTYLTVWPAGQGQPTVSSINLAAGEIRANAVTVALGAGGVHLYNNFGNTNVLADLAGYYAPGTGSRFTSTSPARVLDTRTSGGALGPRGIRTINLSGRVPASATAVTFNLTGVGATTATHVTAWPSGQTRPNASTLNLAPGTTTPNLVTVALGADRSVSLYNHSGSTHLVADLAGYYATDRGHPFYQMAPIRAIDTRSGDPLPGGWIETIDMSPLLPASASSVVFNLTGTNVTSTSGTYLTAFPTGASLPNASNLNLVRGQTSANLVTVALGSGTRVDIFNHVGDTDYLIDIAGYFAPAPAACTTDCAHSWGDNEYGLLGVGTTGGVSTEPGRIDGLSPVVEVTGGNFNAYALRGDGRVFSWGLDDFAGLGTGRPHGMSTVPVQVNNLSGITQIAAGPYATYAVDDLGRAWAWGDNYNGALGDGTMTDRRAPVQVSGLTDVVQVAGGYDTGYALRSDGTVWVWGTNGGSFGDGTYGTGCDQSPVGAGCLALTPVQVHGLTDVVSISATHNSTFAVRGDGTVVAWGYNGAGQLGIGTVGGPECNTDILAPNCLALSPTPIEDLTGVAEIAHGSAAATYALKTDGTVLSWGFNGAGQLGNGTTGIDCADPNGPNCVRPSPGPVSGLTDVTDLAAGTNHGLAVRSDGTVWAWGHNGFGQLGGNEPWSDVPTQVAGLSGAGLVGSSGWTSFAVS